MKKFDTSIGVLKAKLWDLAHFPQSWSKEEKIMTEDIEEAVKILEREQKNENIRRSTCL